MSSDYFTYTPEYIYVLILLLYRSIALQLSLCYWTYMSAYYYTYTTAYICPHATRLILLNMWAHTTIQVDPSSAVLILLNINVLRLLYLCTEYICPHTTRLILLNIYVLPLLYRSIALQPSPASSASASSGPIQSYLKAAYTRTLRPHTLVA